MLVENEKSMDIVGKEHGDIGGLDGEWIGLRM